MKRIKNPINPVDGVLIDGLKLGDALFRRRQLVPQLIAFLLERPSLAFELLQGHPRLGGLAGLGCLPGRRSFGCLLVRLGHSLPNPVTGLASPKLRGINTIRHNYACCEDRVTHPGYTPEAPDIPGWIARSP